jgi:hypothetical protein
MKAMTATWTNGRILPDAPADWPEGCRLLVEPLQQGQLLGVPDDESADTPEAIEAWLRWYDALEPLEFAPDERAAWEKAREEDKRLELQQWEQSSKRVEGIFP